MFSNFEKELIDKIDKAINKRPQAQNKTLIFQFQIKPNTISNIISFFENGRLPSCTKYFRQTECFITDGNEKTMIQMQEYSNFQIEMKMLQYTYILTNETIFWKNVNIQVFHNIILQNEFFENIDEDRTKIKELKIKSFLQDNLLECKMKFIYNIVEEDKKKYYLELQIIIPNNKELIPNYKDWILCRINDLGPIRDCFYL